MRDDLSTISEESSNCDADDSLTSEPTTPTETQTMNGGGSHTLLQLNISLLDTPVQWHTHEPDTWLLPSQYDDTRQSTLSDTHLLDFPLTRDPTRVLTSDIVTAFCPLLSYDPEIENALSADTTSEGAIDIHRQSFPYTCCPTRWPISRQLLTIRPY